MVEGGSKGGDAARSRGLVEEYTPDGPVGRFLLSCVTSFVTFFAMAFTIAGFTTPGALSALLGALFGALFLGSALLTLSLLWPIYLSLIGKIESTADYTVGSDDAAPEPDDPVAALKHQYATGELSESEFERRLERLVGVEAVEQSRGALDGRDGDGIATGEVDHELGGSAADESSGTSRSVDAIADELEETDAGDEREETDAGDERRETDAGDEREETDAGDELEELE